jgi:hypothetical protein
VRGHLAEVRALARRWEKRALDKLEGGRMPFEEKPLDPKKARQELASGTDNEEDHRFRDDITMARRCPPYGCLDPPSI